MKTATTLVGLVLLAAGCGSHAPPTDTSRTTSLLPPAAELGGWLPEGVTRLFPGAELYGHIDGGAEVFLELGFELLEVQGYRLGDHEISLELYHMSDPAAALGIYLMKCGPEESPAAGLAARNTTTDLQLHMVHDDLYLTVNNLDGDAATARALPELARVVVTQLPAATVQPDCLALLPEAGQIAGSIRIIRGPFTMQGVTTLGEGDVLQLLATETTAVAADYGDPADPWTLMVAAYSDAEQAEAAFSHAVTHLDSYLEIQEQGDGFIRFTDWRQHWGELRLDGSRIHVRVNLTEPPAAT